MFEFVANLFGRSPSSHATSAPRSSRSRLSLEALEVREVPAALVTPASPATPVLGASAKATVLPTAQAVAQVIWQGYATPTDGPKTPIGIAPVLNQKNTYFVALSGTDIQFNQATGIPEDLLSSVNLPNQYRSVALQAIRQQVPSGSTVILSGHSLGGMVAQQLVPDLQGAGYRVAEVETFGSPVTTVPAPGVRYVRFSTPTDLVPNLSPAGAVLSIAGNPEQIRVASPGATDPIAAHLAYPDDLALAWYDALGNPLASGGAALTLGDFVRVAVPYVAPSAGNSIGAAGSYSVLPNGTAFVLTTDARLQVSTNGRGWQTIDTGVASFAALPNGTVIEQTTSGQLRANRADGRGWQTIDTGVQSFGVLPNGTVFDLNTAGQLKVNTDNGRGWQTIDTGVRSFDVLPNGTVIEQTTTGQLRANLADGRGWQTIDTGVQSYSALPSGTVFSLNSNGQLKVNQNDGRGSQPLDTGVKSFAVLPNGTVVDRTTTGQVRVNRGDSQGWQIATTMVAGSPAAAPPQVSTQPPAPAQPRSQPSAPPTAPTPTLQGLQSKLAQVTADLQATAKSLQDRVPDLGKELLQTVTADTIKKIVEKGGTALLNKASDLLKTGAETVLKEAEQMVNDGYSSAGAVFKQVGADVAKLAEQLKFWGKFLGTALDQLEPVQHLIGFATAKDEATAANEFSGFVRSETQFLASSVAVAGTALIPVVGESVVAEILVGAATSTAVGAAYDKYAAAGWKDIGAQLFRATQPAPAPQQTQQPQAPKGTSEQPKAPAQVNAGLVASAAAASSQNFTSALTSASHGAPATSNPSGAFVSGLTNPAGIPIRF